MIGQIKQFLACINDHDFAIVGSGSCSHQILDILQQNALPKPSGWFDDNNLGTLHQGMLVQPLSEIPNNTMLLIASEDFVDNIRAKLKGAKKNNIAIGIYDLEGKEPKSKSAHGIIINTIPKCGNNYIVKNIRQNLGLNFTHVCAGPWPDMYLSTRLLSSVLSGQSFTVDHIPVNKFNLSALKDSGVSKLVTHVRDPRQALLSWLHWIERKNSNGSISLWEIPKSNKNYFELSLEQKIDYQIENWLPTLVNFIIPWVELGDKYDLDILFTDFTDMKYEPEAFFSKINHHFLIDSPFTNIMAAEQEKAHFRKGLDNEWMDVFNAAQLKKVNSMLPELLLNQFNWKK